MLIQATLRGFCAGLIVHNGKVTEAAPILAWAVGLPLEKVTAYVLRHGGEMRVVKREPEER